MKSKQRGTVLGLVIVLVLAGVILGVYLAERQKSRYVLARRIAELSPRGGVPVTIEGLRSAIAIYEKAIEEHVRDAAQTGAYWKILAVRLADRGMHLDALDALEMSIRYNGEDPTLFYLTGVSAAIVAKNALGLSRTGPPETMPEERERYFAVSERAYLRAIELDGAYAKPRYGLGILYTFEMDRPAEAVPHLEKYLELMSRDVDAMFTLARAYYMTEAYEKAIDLYDRIIVSTKDADKKDEARNNRDYIMGQMR
ncbi:MAG: tetratricopeptide repeat protein [Treponema sp.]|jgi:tetratricopeptide (TPR) repeat protein|nr:tetratricopeptide repeat protein [Treponema sp.]